MPHAVDSPESSPASSLKHSPSKREKVRQFIHRVSSIGHRSRHERGLSQAYSAAETQASGSERGGPSPEPQPLIDLTVDAPAVIPVRVTRRDSTSSLSGSVLRHKAGRLTADDGSSFHSSSPSESSASDAQSLTSSHKPGTARFVAGYLFPLRTQSDFAPPAGLLMLRSNRRLKLLNLQG